MTTEALSILRHSLGLDDNGRGKQYRNHFCAGGADVAVCRALVAQGFMQEHQPNDITGGDPWFTVTAKGISVAQDQLPSGEYIVAYPFVHSTFPDVDIDPEGVSVTTRPTWKPGIEYIATDPFGGTGAEAHGMGQMILTVVSVHKPGRYPTRVFFTRKFVTPDGSTFGKGKLHIVALEKFRRLARGFQVEFELHAKPLAASSSPAPAPVEK